jgi:hypothetical protein
MKKLVITLAALGLFCGVPLSLDWSPTSGPTLSTDSAQARVGRPATVRSGAGVARRTTRRAIRRTIIYCTAPGVPVGCVWR